MATVHVVMTPEEQAAAGLASAEVLYAAAEAQVTPDGILLVYQHATILAEYPAGRYVSWTVVEDVAEEDA